MSPWLGEVTDDVDIMICSDKILTLVEPHKTLVDSYLKLALLKNEVLYKCLPDQQQYVGQRI